MHIDPEKKIRVFPRKMTIGLVFFLCIQLGFLCQVCAENHAINLGEQKHFEGDIFLPQKRNGILASARWTNGIIYYDLGVKWNTKQLDMIMEGMKAIESRTCIRFAPRKNETNYVEIKNTPGGCYATVGMVGGVQQMSLLDSENSGTCFTHATIVHELLHAVGLWHEHSRYDRDQYIKIHWENLNNNSNAKFNMRIVYENESNVYGLPYVYESVMHYDGKLGSMDGNYTMTALKDKRYTAVMGKAKFAHELDFEKVRRIYKCQGQYPPAPAAPSDCADTIEYCKQHLTKCDTEKWMASSCRKSCYMCIPSSMPSNVCQDVLPYACADYKGRCTQETWLKQFCKVTCKFCQ